MGTKLLGCLMTMCKVGSESESVNNRDGWVCMKLDLESMDCRQIVVGVIRKGQRELEGPE